MMLFCDSLSVSFKSRFDPKHQQKFSCDIEVSFNTKLSNIKYLEDLRFEIYHFIYQRKM